MKSGRALFHTQDLALLWGISKRETLYMTISRYIKSKVLFSIQKGLYSVLPPEKIDPLLLGPALLHDYCYLSTESILEREDLMPQMISSLTFVGTKSVDITKLEYSYSFRRLKPEFLYNQAGIYKNGEVLMATVERAVADLWYFSPGYYLDNLKQIDIKKVKMIQREVGYELSKA